MTERDIAVGEEPVGVASLEGPLELGRELSARIADLATQPLQGRARVVGHGAARIEGPAEAIGELGEARQGIGDGGDSRARLTRGLAVGAKLGARFQGRDDLDQLGALEHAAVGATAPEEGTDIGEGFQRERPGGGESQPGLARHLDRRPDTGDLGERLRSDRSVTTHLGQRFVG